MNKLVFVGLFVVVAMCKAQEIPAAAPVDPVEQAIATSAYIIPVLQSRAAAAQLPPAQQSEADQVVVNAQKQLQVCEDNLRSNRLIYVYRICTTTVLRNSINQINAIETAATSTPAAQ